MPDSDAQNQPANQTTDDQDLEQELGKIAEFTKQQIAEDPVLSQSLAATPQLQNIIINIEEDLLREIITRMENNTLTPEKAQQIAKEFISYLPVRDQKDLLEKLQSFSRNNQEAQGIYLKYASAQEEEERKKKIDSMTQHIQNGNLEQAIIVAKGGVPNG